MRYCSAELIRGPKNIGLPDDEVADTGGAARDKRQLSRPDQVIGGGSAAGPNVIVATLGGFPPVDQSHPHLLCVVARNRTSA